MMNDATFDVQAEGAREKMSICGWSMTAHDPLFSRVWLGVEAAKHFKIAIGSRLFLQPAPWKQVSRISIRIHCSSSGDSRVQSCSHGLVAEALPAAMAPMRAPSDIM